MNIEPPKIGNGVESGTPKGDQKAFEPPSDIEIPEPGIKKNTKLSESKPMLQDLSIEEKQKRKGRKQKKQREAQGSEPTIPGLNKNIESSPSSNGSSAVKLPSEPTSR